MKQQSKKAWSSETNKYPAQCDLLLTRYFILPNHTFIVSDVTAGHST